MSASHWSKMGLPTPTKEPKPMKLIDHMKSMEAEYREFLSKMIRAKTEQFNKTIEVAKNVRPIRRAAQKHDLRYFWGDQLWCQDVSIMSWDEFVDDEAFKFADDPMNEVNAKQPEDDECAEWLNTVFDSVYRSLADELKLPLDVLES